MSRVKSHNVVFGNTTAQGSGQVYQGGVIEQNYYSANAPNTEQQRVWFKYGAVDPQIEWNRIFSQKTELLENTCAWVFEEAAFQSWVEVGGDSRILWIHGDPGKGKTMIFKALIEQLKKNNDTDDTLSVAFFLCQRTDDRLDSAEAVMKALIFSLARDNPSLKLVLLEQELNNAGQLDLYSLWTTFERLLPSLEMQQVFLCIDALDECASRMHELLTLIVRCRADVRWVITSRNEADIREALDGPSAAVHTSLELHSSEVAMAVERFIKSQVKELAHAKKYDDKLSLEVEKCLLKQSEDTFLWVSLACEELRKTRKINTLTKLTKIPSGLIPLYEYMFSRVEDQEDRIEADICNQILLTASVLFRPLTLSDFGIVCDLPEQYTTDPSYIQELVEEQCGSFLTVQGELVMFIHQSAADFLVRHRNARDLASRVSMEQQRLTVKLIEVLQYGLQRDICGTQQPGVLRYELSLEKITAHIPSLLAYAIRFWIDHLLLITEHMRVDFLAKNEAFIYNFLKVHLLHWFEGLGWLQGTMSTLLNLETLDIILTAHSSSQLQPLVKDACRFLVAFQSSISEAPAQVYYGPLVFSPLSSLIRLMFEVEMPEWLTSRPVIRLQWTNNQRILECPSEVVTAPIFSPSNDTLACALEDGSIMLWGLTSNGSTKRLQVPLDGARLRERLKGPLNGEARLRAAVVSFSQDGSTLVSVSRIGELGTNKLVVNVWDTDSTRHILKNGKVLGSLGVVTSSTDGKYVVIREEYLRDSEDSFKEIVDLETSLSSCMSGANINIRGPILEVLGSLYFETTVTYGHIYDAKLILFESRQDCLISPVRHLQVHGQCQFSEDGRTLLYWSEIIDKYVLVDTSTGRDRVELEQLSGGKSFGDLAISTKGEMVAGYGHESDSIHIWDFKTGKIVQTIKLHDRELWGDPWISPDSKKIVLQGVGARFCCQACFFDLSIDEAANSEEPPLKPLFAAARVNFSSDGKFIAYTTNDDYTVRLWDPSDVPTLLPAREPEFEISLLIQDVAIAPNGTLVACSSRTSGVTIWNTHNKDHITRIAGDSGILAVSHDGKRIAVVVMERATDDKDRSVLKNILKLYKIGPPSEKLSEISLDPTTNEAEIAPEVARLEFAANGLTMTIVRENRRVDQFDLETLTLHTVIDDIFKHPGLANKTRLSIWDLDLEWITMNLERVMELPQLAFSLLALNDTGTWVTNAAGARLLWLPSELGPTIQYSNEPCRRLFAVRNRHLVIPTASKRLVILEFDTNALKRAGLYVDT